MHSVIRVSRFSAVISRSVRIEPKGHLRGAVRNVTNKDSEQLSRQYDNELLAECLSEVILTEVDRRRC